jgi:hypothetical protein
MADFASAFLARDQSTATDFDVVTTPCCSVWSAQRADPTNTALSKLVRVWKPLQDWIVPCRPEVFNHPAEDRIQQRTRVHDVQVERD